MAIHRKREEAKPGARLVLESHEPVELPPATIRPEDVTVEREEFKPHLEELLDLLRHGVIARPAPVVFSDSVFIIESDTRSFWVRIWHLGGDRTEIDRLHLSSCLPRVPGLRLPGMIRE
jgi:hypothetical protein